jgi:hypothetical protein
MAGYNSAIGQHITCPSLNYITREVYVIPVFQSEINNLEDAPETGRNNNQKGKIPV